MEIRLAGNEDLVCPGHTTVANPAVGSMRQARRRLRRPFPWLLPGCECGAWSGEFAFAILVLALAIFVGSLGGIWIAKRELVQKPKAAEPPQVTAQPSDQPEKQPESHEAAKAPPEAPPPKASESPSKAPLPKAPEVAPQAVKPGPKPHGGPQLPSFEAIHYSSKAGTTEVTIELGAASLVEAAGISNPERVYFDLQTGDRSAHSRGRMDARNAMEVRDDGLLAGIRVARWTSGEIRVVLDLKRPCDFTHRISPQPTSRLIVELKAR